MLRQAEKWFPDLGTMVSGHLLIYVVSAKGNHERIIPWSHSVFNRTLH